MKKLLSLSCIALLGAALSLSCNKLPETAQVASDSGDMATLRISLSGIDTDINVRASTTEEHSGDKTATDIQILIYDSAGNFIQALDEQGLVSLSKGMVYTVVAIINGPNNVGEHLSLVSANRIDLSSHPYAMTGMTTADLRTASSLEIELNVSSIASRIHLKSIKNNLPPAFGNLVLKKVFLCNVMDGMTVFGNESDTWQNNYGRKALNTLITPNSLEGSVDSTVPTAATTHKAFDDQVIASEATFNANSWFYTFPSSHRESVPSNLASSTVWTPQSTWITVCGTIGGTVYYWTSNLGSKLQNGLERNKSYDIAIVLNNLGTGDPATLTTPGHAEFTVAVTPWQAGSEINETI